jgi:FkbM family methyltransferase
MIRNLLFGLLNAINLPLGIARVQLVRSRMAEAQVSRRLRALDRAGFRPRVALDGGAFVGDWSLDLRALYPDCRLIVAEPNPAMMDRCLRKLGSAQPTPCFEQCALGSAPGVAKLKLWAGSAGSAASLLDHVSGPATNEIEVEVRTIDEIVERIGLIPDLMKLDLQGFELAALRGADRALDHVQVVIVEISCLPAYIGRSSPGEIFEFMYRRGFELHDIADLGYRPADGALASADMTFVRSTSSIRSYAGYR